MSANIISAEDEASSVRTLLFKRAEFFRRFEVHSFRSAARVLSGNKAEFNELLDQLTAFSIKTEDIVAGGGNKSKIAMTMDTLLHPLGWRETRIIGDLHIRLLTGDRPRALDDADYDFRIPRFVDGHKIDFVKNRVAFDMEWNSKDQTFDRDLYAMRTFHDCNIIRAGVLLTRSAALGPVFADIQNRVTIPNFKSKYGASTTWMGKLIYRINAGRAGGCPILALGIKPAVIDDFEAWKTTHSVIRRTKFDINAEEDEAIEPV